MLQFKKTLLGGIAPLLLSIALASPVIASDGHHAHGKNHNFGAFNKDNILLTPRGYREWVFVGGPVTPNDMNDGKAVFPEFHNVYIDPTSWNHWKKTGEFRDGTVIVKELVSVGSKSAPSGNGYFAGEFNGIAAMVKDSKRFPNRPGNWAFFGFESYDAKEGAIQADEACAACHKDNAAQDMVFTQYYPVLRAAKPKK
ncbi:MAG: cytochrome P460 family protein [Nitrosomonas sp.]|uniref:cytochrome P460 family protein n=1 Tax=Nitrosomonas sp. TaxID=42353 RepID=UPI001A4172D9|nr:cytochrome P460 family protein [Nitrosomonas sp.]MBL8500575.1 cytochrome P460 family protein [Nitrosomonas sp.]MCG7756633.1 cytochrome P460 family protein [Nitrosomonas sp.]UJP00741.1 MAG: cytochrome P460 family protein [Nitrosomonas sp.]UJP02643.1 MAG: cytochrome P460 family protein [Nitrosomonas sp.]